MTPHPRLAACFGCLVIMVGSTTQAHELWFQPTTPTSPLVRLTFGDSPAPAEAERVAEIAHAQVWLDGQALEVRRLADGLEVAATPGQGEILSATADRGVVDYQGDSFIITLAAYTQARPVRRTDHLKLGLDDDQLRLLLVVGEHGTPVVRATWKGRPATDVVVKLFRGAAASASLRTDGNGEVACPDLNSGAVSLLAQVVDRTPGTRAGKPYSEIRHKATLTLTSKGD